MITLLDSVHVILFKVCSNFRTRSGLATWHDPVLGEKSRIDAHSPKTGTGLLHCKWSAKTCSRVENVENMRFR